MRKRLKRTGVEVETLNGLGEYLVVGVFPNSADLFWIRFHPEPERDTGDRRRAAGEEQIRMKARRNPCTVWLGLDHEAEAMIRAAYETLDLAPLAVALADRLGGGEAAGFDPYACRAGHDTRRRDWDRLVFCLASPEANSVDRFGKLRGDEVRDRRPDAGRRALGPENGTGDSPPTPG